MSSVLPRLSVLQLFNLCVGIIGIQFAWSMQIALSSRVLEPLGADPFLFGLIWCAGPVTGLLVQPIIGAISDRTWTPLGRRKPFIIAGAILGALALLFFPFSPTLLIAALLIWIIDACVNVSQGPYRALVPDITPPEQNALANSYLNFAFGAGSVISLGVAPLLRYFNIAMSVEQQYMMAAAALICLIAYTSLTIKEIQKPSDLAAADGPEKKGSFFSAFSSFFSASREIHKVCAVQFFTWLGVMSMFIYLAPFVQHQIYQLPDLSTPEMKQLASLNQVIDMLPNDTNLKADQIILLAQPLNTLLDEPERTALETATLDTRLDSALISTYGEAYTHEQLIPQLQAIASQTDASPLLDFKLLALQAPLQSDSANTTETSTTETEASLSTGISQWFEQLQQEHSFGSLLEQASNTTQLSLVAFNLIPLLFSIPIGALTNKLGKKPVYTVALSCMAVAFLSAPFLQAPEHIIVMMTLAGVAWATILSIPFAFLGDYMPKGDEGSIMGIFNMFIAAPQLISATAFSWLILQNPIETALGSTHSWWIAFVLGGLAVLIAIGLLQWVKEKRPA